MGEMQSVDGGPISFAKSHGIIYQPRRGRDLVVLARVVNPAVSQIRLATDELTRLNDDVKNCESVIALASCNIVTSIPSSMP